MPVTIIPASHQPKSHPPIEQANSLEHFLQESCPDLYVAPETKVVASSFHVNRRPLYPSSSSLVRSAIEAWGRHSHLLLRPDDVWFAILVQLNFYMKKNSESLRHLFVSHGGKEEIMCWGEDYDQVIELFQAALSKRIKTDWLHDWITPDFTTSTVHDRRTATVLMMGLLKGYFDYGGGIICGIPSITLLGEKGDWQHLLAKTERLADFGDEPKDYASRLQPILSRMISSFDSATSSDTRMFWDQMVHAKVDHREVCGKPPDEYILSGWIMGLFYWDSQGLATSTFTQRGRLHPESIAGSLVYDGIVYGPASLNDIPVAYAKADFRMVNEHPGPHNAPWEGCVIAGNIGKSIVDGAPEGYEAIFGPVPKPKSVKTRNERLRSLLKTRGVEDALREAEVGHSTIQPASGWVLFGPKGDTTSPYIHEDELAGPTVDAINSCKGIQHIDKRPRTKNGSVEPRQSAVRYSHQWDSSSEKSKRSSLFSWAR